MSAVWTFSADATQPAYLSQIYCKCKADVPPVDKTNKEQHTCADRKKFPSGRQSYLKLRGRGDAFEAACLAVEPPLKKAAKKGGKSAKKE